MPVGSFSLTQVIPELTAGLIKYITEGYDETHGFSKIAKETKPQYEQKIHIMGKTRKRYVAGDIPQRGKVGYIKDSKFTDDLKTATEYGRGFTINVDDLMLNKQMPVNFNTKMMAGRGSSLSERVNNASNMCVEEIRRGEDMQVKNILETCTLQFDNYPVIDFDRDTDLSEVISTANLKWSIANAATMDSFKDLDDWCLKLATIGNCGGDEFVGLFGTSAYNAHINSEKYAADSDVRRNYKVTKNQGITYKMNRNIPEGALYRETIQLPTGILHVFTYDQNYMLNDGSDTITKWLNTNYVHIISVNNVIERQPVYIPNMMELMPMTSETKSLMRQIPNSSSWLIHPDWKECDMFTFAMNIRKQFLTIPLTPNKMFTATVNS